MFGDFVVEWDGASGSEDEIGFLFFAVLASIVEDDELRLRGALAGGKEFFVREGRFVEGWSVMALAVKYRSVRCIRALCDMGVTMHYVRSGESTLSFLVRYDPDFIPTALELGIDPNARNHDGSTSLFYTESTEVLQALLAHGGNIHAVGDSGATAAVLPLVMRLPTLLDAHLARGLGDVPALPDGAFPIHVCARIDFVQGAVVNIKHGCPLEVLYEDLTPLEHAVLNESRRTGVELIVAGACVSEMVPKQWIREALSSVRLRRHALVEMSLHWSHLCSQTNAFMTQAEKLRRCMSLLTLSDDDLLYKVVQTPLREGPHNAYMSGMMKEGCRFMAERVCLKFAIEAEAEAHIRTVPLLRTRSYVAVVCAAKLGQYVRARRDAQERTAHAYERLVEKVKQLYRRERKLAAILGENIS